MEKYLTRKQVHREIFVFFLMIFVMVAMLVASVAFLDIDELFMSAYMFSLFIAQAVVIRQTFKEE